MPILPTGPPLKSTSTPYLQKRPLAYDLQSHQWGGDQDPFSESVLLYPQLVSTQDPSPETSGRLPGSFDSCSSCCLPVHTSHFCSQNRTAGRGEGVSVYLSTKAHSQLLSLCFSGLQTWLLIRVTWELKWLLMHLSKTR